MQYEEYDLFTNMVQITEIPVTKLIRTEEKL